MVVVCIPKFALNSLRQKIKDELGSDFGSKLALQMSSSERRTFFSKALGSDELGKFMNTKFEKALATKNLNGLKQFAKEYLSDKERQMPEYLGMIKKFQSLADKGVFDVKNAQNQFEDLIASTLKVGLNSEELAIASNLSSRISEYKTKLDEINKNIDIKENEFLKNNPEWNNKPYSEQELLEQIFTKEEIEAKTKLENEHGMAIVDTIDFINSRGEFINLKDYWKNAPLKQKIYDALSIPRALMTSADLSYTFNQLFSYMARDKGANLKSAIKGFDYARKAQKYKELRAYILGHQNYKLAKDAGLRLSAIGDIFLNKEDVYMNKFVEALPNTIPGIGEKGLKGMLQASERAFQGALTEFRFKRFNSLVDLARLAGEDVSMGSKTLKEIAEAINTGTGTGNIGKGDRFKGAVPFLNTLLFSPRKVAASLRVLDPSFYFDFSKNKTRSKIALMEARQNAISRIVLSAGILATYYALNPNEEAELDPTSSNFGKIKMGYTRADATGGMASYINLLTRIVSGKKKSSTSDKVVELGSGFGVDTRKDVIFDAVQNKFAPLLGHIARLADERKGEKEKEKLGELGPAGLLIPLVAQSFYESGAKNDDWVIATISAIFDIFGFGTNTWGEK